MAKDYYEILGVKKTDDDNTIKMAYKKLAKKYHPDMHHNIDEKTKKEYTSKFQEINNAYEVLKDPKSRATYDQVGPDQYDNYKQGGGHSGFNDFSGFSGFSGFENMEDIFGGFFSQGKQYKESAVRGEDLLYKMEITLEQAFKGFVHEIKINKKIKCTDCSGAGNAGKNIRTCTKCKGQGKINVRQLIFNIVETCDMCSGSGKVCGTCGGECRINSVVNTKIIVPSGVYNNLEIKNKQEGNAGIGGGYAGDLIIQFKVKEHSVFKVKNNDLYINVPIDVFQAILGDTIEIPLIEGTSVEHTFSGVVQNDMQCKIAGKGMSIVGKNYRGDMYLVFNVQLPKNVDSEIEDWRKMKKIYDSKNNSKSIFSNMAEYLKSIKFK